MAWVSLTNVAVKGPNPAPINADFSFEVAFVCNTDLASPLQWRLLYVGCADDDSKDQEIELVELGPIKRGSLKFTLDSDPPDFSLIHPDDIWGTTVLLLEGSYRNQDFVRVGWYVHNVYVDPILQDDPPDVPLLDKMVRYIVADEPRVTDFKINWSGDPEPIALPVPMVVPPQNNTMSEPLDDIPIPNSMEEHGMAYSSQHAGTGGVTMKDPATLAC